MGQLLGGVEVLWAQASDGTRAETRRIDVAYRNWEFLTDLSSADLLELDQMIQALKYNLNETSLAKLLLPHFTRRHIEVANSISFLEKELSLINHQAVINVTRIVMDEGGNCDWKVARDVFNAKYEYKRGAEAALAANQIVPAAARA
jgi:hypothetical protein